MAVFMKKLFAWFEERVELEGVIHLIKKKEVPKHRHSIWYYFGGVTLFLFIMQVLTGILLLFYYKANEELAFESIKFLMSKVAFGWLIRSIHSWSANLMILAAFIHMFSVFFTKAYRKPREMTWVTGMILFMLALGFGFSGYLLPWNELALFATKVGTDIAGALPFVGEPILQLLRGGEQVTGATLSRFFGFHIALFPGIFTVFLTIHLLLVQSQGMSAPMEEEHNPNKKAMPFFPNFVLRDLLLWLIVLNILAILAVFFPWELGHKADPFASAPAGIKPEWYFLFMFQVLKFLPAKMLIIDGELFGILAFGLGGILWTIIPFIDRKSARGEKDARVLYFGIFIVIFILVFTILGWLL
jgi:cytochrome b6